MMVNKINSRRVAKLKTLLNVNMGLNEVRDFLSNEPLKKIC